MSPAVELLLMISALLGGIALGVFAILEAMRRGIVGAWEYIKRLDWTEDDDTKPDPKRRR